MRPLIVDNFAGGGGASTGIEAALGFPIDIAINHDPEAIAMHRANHPETRHYCQDVWSVDPVEVTAGRPVGLAWFSPDCKHFSKAKGGKPREKKIRDLAWVVHRWIEALKPFGTHPLVIMLENVEEFRTWGPLLEDGKPCPDRRGETFDDWVQQLRDHGYKVEWRELKACDYGAPTSRKRLLLIARRDGEPIVWPAPTHGAGRPLPWRTAADIIDWSIPCPSIFTRTRPLKDATCRRIATGIMRYVVNADRPFIVPVTNSNWAKDRAYDGGKPLPTITTAKGGEFAVAVPYFARTAHGDQDRNGKRRGRGWHGVEECYPTVTTSNDSVLVTPTLIQTGYGERDPYGRPPNWHCNRCGEDWFDYYAPTPESLDSLCPPECAQCGTEDDATWIGGQPDKVSAFLAQHNGGPRNKNIAGHAADKPVSTITGRGTQQQIVTSNLIELRNNCSARGVDEPLGTITAGGGHFAEVRAFLIKYYGNERDGHTLFDPLGTVTTKDRFGMVTVSIDGTEYAIADIGMRMLSARELYAAQGFPADYDIAVDLGGKPLTKTAQVRMVGNSVSPPLPEALVRANLPHLCNADRMAA